MQFEDNSWVRSLIFLPPIWQDYLQNVIRQHLAFTIYLLFLNTKIYKYGNNDLSQ